MPWKYHKSLCGDGCVWVQPNLVKCFGPRLLLWTCVVCLCQGQAFQLISVDHSGFLSLPSFNIMYLTISFTGLFLFFLNNYQQILITKKSGHITRGQTIDFNCDIMSEDTSLSFTLTRIYCLKPKYSVNIPDIR